MAWPKALAAGQVKRPMEPLAARYENAHPLSLSAGGFLLCGLCTFRRTGAVNALYPMKVLFAGSGFKLIFYDAEVYFAVKSKPCPGVDIAVFIRKIKFLLVHCGRGQQGGIYPLSLIHISEPTRH